ncbi:MAG: flagellar biosynthetic protein FliO [Pirellulaceae bacterium]|nr:FliO/MopB family protein [Planctomycetales bacterium]
MPVNNSTQTAMPAHARQFGLCVLAVCLTMPAPECMATDTAVSAPEPPQQPAFPIQLTAVEDTRSTDGSVSGPGQIRGISLARRLSDHSATSNDRLHESLYTVASSLAIVFAAFFLLVWIARRTGLARAGNTDEKLVDVMARVALSSKLQLHIVRVGRRILVLSVSNNHMEAISEITEADEVEFVTSMCGTRQRTDAFSTWLQRQLEQPHQCLSEGAELPANRWQESTRNLESPTDASSSAPTPTPGMSHWDGQLDKLVARDPKWRPRVA